MEEKKGEGHGREKRRRKGMEEKKRLEDDKQRNEGHKQEWKTQK